MRPRRRQPAWLVLPAALLGAALALADEPTDDAGPGPAGTSRSDQASAASESDQRAPRDWASQVRDLARRLRSSRYTVRREATEALQALPVEAAEHILAAYRRTILPEVRKRLASAIDDEDVARLLADRPNSRLGYFGMSFGAVPVPVAEGNELIITVGEVLADSPAAKAGLQAGDVIVSVNSTYVAGLSGTDVFGELIAKLPPGAEANLVVQREAGLHKLELTVGNRLLDAPEPWRSQWREEAVERFWQEVNRAGGAVPR
jgi:C-terminal processing protease CtpA/Prc